MRKEIIGDCILYHGDCRDILPILDKVDAILTDVPYELEQGGRSGLMGGKFDPKNYDNKGSIIPVDIEFDEFMPLLGGLLDYGHAYFMVNNRYIGAIENSALKAGFRFHNWLVWDKSTGTPNRWYMKNCEFTLFVFKGKARQINDCGAKQLVKVQNITNTEHDTQKPVELMQHYIANSTQPKQTILDPFMGSGTTGVACVNLDRKFIGIEKEIKYFDITCKRIETAHKQPRLFKEPVAKPIQEGLI